jgi:ParB family chromosome partitioning protein
MNSPETKSDPKRRSLGRGLSALLSDDGSDYGAAEPARALRTLPVEQLGPGRLQPRRRIDEEDLADLAQSIREKGVLQPILVRRHPDDPDLFEIIAGERRWRAAQLAQLHEVPVIVKDLTDRETLEVALIENLQRQDLSPLEEADGYRRLLEEFEHTQEDLARSLGRSRSHVANTIRLLGLPDEVKAMVEDRQLSAGHARALLTADDPTALARTVVARQLNVRQTERLVQSANRPPRTVPQPATKDADSQALERDLSALLGLKVEIRFQGGGGSLTLHYGSLEQLDDILHRLRHDRDRALRGAPDVPVPPLPEDS